MHFNMLCFKTDANFVFVLLVLNILIVEKRKIHWFYKIILWCINIFPIFFLISTSNSLKGIKKLSENVQYNKKVIIVKVKLQFIDR